MAKIKHKKKPLHKRVKAHHIIGIAFLAVALGITVSSFGFLSTAKTASAQCTGTGPGIPRNVVAKAGPQKGQTTLTWQTVPGADKYTINYGTKSGSYTYGVANVLGGNPTQSLTISNLTPGTTYYYRIFATRNCNPGLPSSEVSAVSM